MKTKRVITEKDSRNFFKTTINSIEDAMGIGEYDIEKNQIVFDFNAVLLLGYDKIYADTKYDVKESLFDSSFVSIISKIDGTISVDAEYEYVRHHDKNCHFLIKLEKIDESLVKLYIICKEKLVETEEQLELFSNVVGLGESMFAGCTWWINYDRHKGCFYSTDSGPNILGIKIPEDKIYITSEFQKVRDEASKVSEFYEECVQTEMLAYEAVRNNVTDYFGGRTPAVKASGEVIWVEAYGKCLIRYPDGSPRFFVAIDIYLSNIFEESHQLKLLTNLVDYGLESSEVGIWYYQFHFTLGRYFFTDSYQKLMGGGKTYKNETFTDIFNDQIAKTMEMNPEYVDYLHEFRKTHNSVFSGKLDKYHLMIPNYKDGNEIQWIEVRGSVIERDTDGEVLLFVGVNVDVTESYLRNRELEELRIRNERLQIAERLAVKARNLMVWYQEESNLGMNGKIFGNVIFNEKLGVKRSPDGLIEFSELRNTVLTNDQESSMLARKFLAAISKLFKQKIMTMKKMLVKHINLVTKEVMYLEHSMEVSELNKDGSIKLIGGIIIDVTERILIQEKTQYLADYDTLTDVYNRNYFESYIKNHLPDTYSIMVFDVDGLKLINDAFGHYEGDKIIIKVAAALKECFTNNLFVARIGGDEFVVLTEEVEHQIVTDKANLFEAAIDKHNVDSPIQINVSKGGKAVLKKEMTFDKAFIHAENLMYRRKLNSRSSRKSKVLDSIIETLNAKTEETKEHSVRLAENAVKTMIELGMSRASEIEAIELLSRVHDIGKITIPDNILNKPSKLTKAEFEVIIKHAEAGYKIIKNITESDDVCNGVLFHHERWDGKGYPQGLKEEEIPIFARVISVVDSYDAMTSNRVYQKMKTHEEAVKEVIRCSGTQFDPKVVKAFLKSCFGINI